MKSEFLKSMAGSWIVFLPIRKLKRSAFYAKEKIDGREVTFRKLLELTKFSGCIMVGLLPDGTYVVLDGWYRITVLKDLGESLVRCVVIPLRDQKHEKELHYAMNFNVTQLSPEELHSIIESILTPEAFGLETINEEIEEIVSKPKAEENEEELRKTNAKKAIRRIILKYLEEDLQELITMIVYLKKHYKISSQSELFYKLIYEAHENCRNSN